MIRGFISYAHNDYWALEKMLVHLKSIENMLRGEIEFWADTRIQAGDYWTAEIEAAIDAADLHLLLVSAQFFGSKYIWEHELPAINRRYAAGTLVVPMILRGCMWERFVGPLQAVPTWKGRAIPICDWSPQDTGFYVATSQILHAIQTHFPVIIDSGLNWNRP